MKKSELLEENRILSEIATLLIFAGNNMIESKGLSDYIESIGLMKEAVKRSTELNILLKK